MNDPPMTALLSTVACVLGTTCNVVLYVALGRWWNLAAAVFCGMCLSGCIALVVATHR